MDESRRQLIERLNDMYQSQGSDFKSRYRDHYFELLEFIMNPYQHRITGEEVRAQIDAMARFNRRLSGEKEGDV